MSLLVSSMMKYKAVSLFVSGRIVTTLMEYKVESGWVNRQFRIPLPISVEVQIDVDQIAHRWRASGTT